MSDKNNEEAPLIFKVLFVSFCLCWLYCVCCKKRNAKEGTGDALLIDGDAGCGDAGCGDSGYGGCGD